MKKFLLPESGTFYKTNLHCHTNISDGALSPEEIKEIYRSKGYSAVCYTDHEVLIGHKDLCDDSFIALHGYEVAIKKDIHSHTGNFMPVYHFNMIAEDQDNLIMPRCFEKNPSMPGSSKAWFDKYKPYDPNDVIEVTEYNIPWLKGYLSAVRDAGFLITYNHPRWSLQSCTDFIGLEGLFAIEIINGACWRIGDYTPVYYDEMLRSGMWVVPVAGDDNHRLPECGAAWTMIKAEKLTYDALIKAYKNGNCYASNGPEIKELYIEDGKLNVKSSPAAAIILQGEGRYTASECDTDTATFNFSPEVLGNFFRVEVRDGSGHVAFSRAYKTADLLS